MMDQEVSTDMNAPKRSGHTLQPIPMFEGGEHMETAADVNLTIVHDDGSPYQVKAVSYSLAPSDPSIASRINWTFARLIALFGDFYADPFNPISSGSTPSARQDQAKLNVISLETDADGYLTQITKVLDEEYSDLTKWVDDGLVEAQEYNNKSDTYNNEFENAIGSIKYGSISWNNMDHFGNDAKLAYIATHGYALDLAAQAYGQTGASKTSTLITAYRADAMACHFLTDLFSAGHLRVPRRELHQNIVLAGWDHWMQYYTYDDVAHLMHDEDCAVGMVAENAKGLRWTVYGDKQYMTGHNRPNRYMATQGVQASVDEIWQASLGGQNWVNTLKTSGGYAAFQWIPNFDGLFGDNQPAAFWKLEGNGQMSRRTDLQDRSNPLRYISTEYNQVGPGQLAASDLAFTNLYLITRPVIIESGGFVQIQDLKKGAGYETFFNVWGPVNTLHGVSLGIQNRILSTSIQPGGLDTTAAAPYTSILDWVRYKGTGAYRGYDTYFRFHCHNTTNELLVEYARLQRPNNTAGWMGDTMNLTTYRPKDGSESQSLSGRRKPRILGQWTALRADAFTQTRFFVDAFTYHASTDDPQLFVWNLSQDSQNKCSAHFTMWKSILSSTASSASSRISPDISFPVNDGARFIKKVWVTQTVMDGFQMNSKVGLHLWQWEAQNDHYTVWRYMISEDGNQDLQLSWSPVDLAYKFSMPRTRNNWVVLTASGQGQGQSLTHGVLLEGNFPDLHVSFFDNWEGFSNLYTVHEQGVTRSAASTALPVYAVDFQRYHFAAINEPAPGRGYETLIVSTVTHGAGNFYTHFRTYRDGNYVDSEVSDELLNNTGDLTSKNRFFSQTWLRTKAAYVDRTNPNSPKQIQADNAILHIYSLFGVLGCRLFIEISTARDGSGWILGGQIPYMAQNSSGTGMGNAGRWNYGILPCGEGLEWADIQYWTPTTGWGMGVPGNATWAYGWEHDKMPTGGN